MFWIETGFDFYFILANCFFLQLRSESYNLRDRHRCLERHERRHERNVAVQVERHLGLGWGCKPDVSHPTWKVLPVCGSGSFGEFLHFHQYSGDMINEHLNNGNNWIADFHKSSIQIIHYSDARFLLLPWQENNWQVIHHLNNRQR